MRRLRYLRHARAVNARPNARVPVVNAGEPVLRAKELEQRAVLAMTALASTLEPFMRACAEIHAGCVARHWSARRGTDPSVHPAAWR